MMARWQAATLATALVLSPLAATAQQNGSKPAPSVTEANTAHVAEPSSKLLGMTVHEAWVESGRNEDKFFDMVKQLAEYSSDKRHVSLPNTETAGRTMGTLIKTSARRDPDQLLYAVVDTAVKQTAGTTAHTTASPK